MKRFDNGLYIPRPSAEVYDLGLELAQDGRVPELFSHLYRNGVHALAAAIDDLGRVRSIAQTPSKPGFLDMQSYRHRHSRDAADLRFVGEGLLALTHEQHSIAGSLVELSPGFMMSPVNINSGITVQLESSSTYTEMIVTDGVRNERRLAGGLVEAFVIGHEVFVDKPQEPGASSQESRVRLITMGAKKYTGANNEALVPMPPYIQPNSLPETIEHMDNTLWEASQLLAVLSRNL